MSKVKKKKEIFNSVNLRTGTEVIYKIPIQYNVFYIDTDTFLYHRLMDRKQANKFKEKKLKYYVIYGSYLSEKLLKKISEKTFNEEKSFIRVSRINYSNEEKLNIKEFASQQDCINSLTEPRDNEYEVIYLYGKIINKPIRR